jgi:multisubunit Na+/H+ antiporter MnhC subunit
VIPLPVILVEFLVAFGLALFGANALALVRLRRDGNWPPTRPAARATGPAPSAARIVTGIVVGFVVALWAVATWIAHSFHF